LPRSIRLTRSFKVLSYPSGMTVSSRALGVLSDVLRAHRNQRRTRWRKLSPGRQALLVLAHLRKGETYADLGAGYGIGTTTVFRYVQEAIEVLAALAPTLADDDGDHRLQSVRDPRRHPAPHRPGRYGRGP
jgi:hypothetical protein